MRELTPTALRLDTRVTNHGFDGTHPTTLQSVLQTGTAVFVDAHGVPRARCYCGNPLTAPTALTGEPKPIGTPWAGYNPRALAAVQPSNAAITNFVLFDIVTGQFFNRPAGTTGDKDTPHTQPVAPPGPASTMATSAPMRELGLDGTYLVHTTSMICGGMDLTQYQHDFSAPLVTHQGDTLTVWGATGPMPGADGSFSGTAPWGPLRGVFATEGGHTVIRDGELTMNGSCVRKFTATKQ